MKSRISKILGVVVTLAMLTALAVGLTAAPASAAPTALGWTTQGTPNATNNVLVAGVQASAFVVSPDGKTVFAWDPVGQNMYVSIDGGVTFPTASRVNIAGAVAPFATRKAFMAISPNYATDKTAVLVQNDTGAVANNHVWWTTNGGTSWVDVANASLTVAPNITAVGEYISSVDIGYYWQTNVLNIIIGVGGAPLATSNVLKFASGGFAWVPFGALNLPVVGVKFSPNHLSDAEIMAVFENVNTFITSSIGGLNFDILGAGAYPDLQVVAGVSTGMAQIAAASDYMANTGANILVGLAGTASATDGVYRISGRTAGASGSVGTGGVVTGAGKPVIGLQVVGPIATATAYYSLGLQATSQVYRSTTFTSSSPVWSAAAKAPTGTVAAATNTLLDTGGTSIFVMTNGTAAKDCALSVSTDGGANFQQTALIDVGLVTGLVFKTLEVVDANTMFIIMNNPAAGYVGNSVFKTTNGGTSWMRILTGPATETLISASPAYGTDATLVVADTAATIVYKSVDGGNSFLPYGVLAAPTALLTTTGGVFYTGAAAVLYKSGAFVGATGITGTVMSIAISPKDTTGATMAVGTNSGTVYQSTNGGTSFTQVGTAGPGAANIKVAYGPDGAIYAADSAAGVYAWSGTAWSGVLQAGTATAIVVSKDNTLYFTDNTPSTATAHGVYRSLNPTATTPVFKTMSYTGSGFTLAETLIGLAVVSGTTADSIYVIDNSAAITTNGYNGALQAFSDTMIAAPAITGPKNNTTVTDTTSTTLSWPAVPGATDYEVTLDGVVLANVTTTSVSTGALTAGSTHTWSVRVDSTTTPVVLGNVYGDPSVTSTFNLSLTSPAPIVTSVVPANGATGTDVNPSFSWPTVAGATSYDFVIAEELGNTDKFAIIDYGDNTPINAYKLKESLKYNTQYWWRVRAVSGTTTSAWNVSFFTTEAMPVATTATSTAPITVNPVTPTVTVTNILPTQQPVTPTIINSGPTQQVIPTYLLWLVIVVGAVLVIAVIVLIVRTRRIS
jgi:hypothetical protein